MASWRTLLPSLACTDASLESQQFLSDSLVEFCRQLIKSARVAARTQPNAPIARDPPHSAVEQGPHESALAWLENCLASRCLSMSDMSVDQVKTRILNALSSEAGYEQDLVDLLGFEDLDFIALILDRREVLLLEAEAANSLSPAALSIGETRQDNLVEDRSRFTRRHTTYRPGAQVSVYTTQDLAAMKTERKLMRKGKLRLTADGDAVDECGEGGVQLGSQSGRSQLPAYPHVYSSSDNWNVFRLSEFGTDFVLPADTVRSNSAEYEQVTLPMAKVVRTLDPTELVSIDSLPDWSRPVFHGYKTLNRMQSKVVPVALNSNENMLICAPQVHCMIFCMVA